MPVEDPRYRTKVYLDTYLTAANLLEDDDATEASFITAFGDPPYSIVRVFNDKEVDLVFSIKEPVSEPLIAYDLTTWGYRERVPIVISCIDKAGVTGEKLKWKAERELRRVCETYPYGSIRHLTDRTPLDQWLGPTRLYSVQWVMNYRRDTT